MIFKLDGIGTSRCEQNPGKLVTAPLTAFNEFLGKNGALTNHDLSEHHRTGVRLIVSFNDAMANPSQDMRYRLSSLRENQVSFLLNLNDILKKL